MIWLKIKVACLTTMQILHKCFSLDAVTPSLWAKNRTKPRTKNTEPGIMQSLKSNIFLHGSCWPWLRGGGGSSIVT